MLMYGAIGAAEPEPSRKDAAEAAQEGDINHWIEYYKAARQLAPTAESRESGQSPTADHESDRDPSGGSRPDVR
jgi:hypothetical protein